MVFLRWLPILVLLVALPASALERFSFVWQGVEREYFVVAPPDKGGPLPTVLVLHGAGGDAITALSNFGWDRKAVEEGFVAVGLNALPPDTAQPVNFRYNPRFWNDLGARTTPAKRQIDDVGYVGQVVERLIQAGRSNPARLFVTGFSSGGAMTMALGQALPTRFLAIAAVSGHVTPPAKAPPDGPSLLYVTGTRDPLNPIAGGDVTIGLWGAKYYKSPPYDTAKLWAEGLDCATDFDTRPNVDTRLVSWVECRNGRHVRYYELLGLGHHWPGQSGGRLPRELVGPYIDTLDATDLIWSFFSAR